MARKATALDVARLAGTSRSAVSMVLNGRAEGSVAREAQVRIREAARQLDYRPNQVARSLRDRRSHVVGLVSGNAVTSAFDGAIIAGANALAERFGFLTLATDTEQDEERTVGAVRTLLDRTVDALIFLTSGLNTIVVPEECRAVPSALANCFPREPPASRFPAFIPDEVQGGADAARHLIGLGHARIAFLGGTMTTPAVLWREQGFREAMLAAGLPIREHWVHRAGWDIVSGHAAAVRVLDGSADERPTALIAANDRAAVGMVLAAASLGLRVPGDLSIVGYDDEQRLADQMVPALTTVALPQRRMGEEAMRAVLLGVGLDAGDAPDLRTLPGAPDVRLVPCVLRERHSTAPPTP
jgi:LacI family transcriptional regulator